MMKTRTITLGLAVGALTFIPVANAQQSGQPQGQQYGQSQAQPMQQLRQQMQQQSSQNQQSQMSGQQQGQGLTQQVRSFLQQAEQQLNQAVKQGNSSTIIQWTRQNVADNATFTTLMQVSSNGRTPSSVRAEYTDKEDMVRKQAMMFSLAPDLLKAVDDYDLDVQIQNVEQIDNNTAIVRTRISESMTLSPMGGKNNARMAQSGMNWQNQQQSGQFGQSSDQAQNQSQQSQGNQLGAALSGGAQQSGTQQNISISGTADCKHLIYRNQGRLMMGMSNCRAETSY